MTKKPNHRLYIPTLHCENCKSIKLLDFGHDLEYYRCHSCGYRGNNVRKT